MPVDFVIFFNVQDCDTLKRFPVLCFLKFNVHLNETKFERTVLFSKYDQMTYIKATKHTSKNSL